MSTTPSLKSLVRMVPQILAEEDGHRAAAIAESEKVRFLVVVDEARAQEFRTIVENYIEKRFGTPVVAQVA